MWVILLAALTAMNAWIYAESGGALNLAAAIFCGLITLAAIVEVSA